jgi:DNA-binding CsgD family transcriptional regulator
MTRASAQLAAVSRVARAASEIVPPPERSAGVLEELRGLIPFVCAEFSAWDPIAGAHRTLSNDGYSSELLDHFNGEIVLAVLDELDMVSSGAPFRMRDVPKGTLTWTQSVQEVLLPAGFREGLTMCLRTADGRYVGMLNLSTDDRCHPNEGEKDAVASLNNVLANVIDASQSCRLMVQLLEPGAAAVVLTGDGVVVELPGLPSSPPLDEGSGALEAARALARARSRRRAFLWPAEDGGWFRVRVTPCRDLTVPAWDVLVTASDNPDVHELTRRELEVLTMVADGKSNPQIAGALWVTPRTVRAHVERILEKLAVPTRAAAAARAVAEGLVLPVRSD